MRSLLAFILELGTQHLWVVHKNPAQGGAYGQLKVQLTLYMTRRGLSWSTTDGLGWNQYRVEKGK